jgi:serine/threonine-protein kinase
MRALEPNKAARYGTASELSSELERYLVNEQVTVSDDDVASLLPDSQSAPTIPPDNTAMDPLARTAQTQPSKPNGGGRPQEVGIEPTLLRKSQPAAQQQDDELARQAVRPSRAPLIAVIALLLIGGGGGATWWLLHSPPPLAPTPTPPIAGAPTPPAVTVPAPPPLKPVVAPTPEPAPPPPPVRPVVATAHPPREHGHHKDPLPPQPAAPAGKGSVDFRVLPWAEVFMGDKKIGVTPMGHPLELPEGHYRFRLANTETGKSETREVDVAAGQKKTVTVDLRAE